MTRLDYRRKRTQIASALKMDYTNCTKNVIGVLKGQRQVGEILYKQVLVALTAVHFSLVDDEPAGLCWNGDCYPETPQLVSNDISKVTCAACKEHFRTLDELKYVQQ